MAIKKIPRKSDSITPLQKWIQARIDAGQRIADIAGALGVSVKSVKAYRAGTRRPGADNLLYIAGVTKLEPAQIRRAVSE